MDALASDNADTLMQVVQGQFQTAVNGLNAQYDGKYLFAGGQINTKPVTATALSDLTAGPPISSFFQNDNFQVQAKLDDSTTVTTGQLASTLGTSMMTRSRRSRRSRAAGRPVQRDPDGRPADLPGGRGRQLGQSIGVNLTTAAAQNGIVQSRVDRWRRPWSTSRTR